MSNVIILHDVILLRKKIEKRRKKITNDLSFITILQLIDIYGNYCIMTRGQ